MLVVIICIFLFCKYLVNVCWIVLSIIKCIWGYRKELDIYVWEDIYECVCIEIYTCIY